MFNVCKRGAASVSRIATSATSIALSTVRRQSFLPTSAGELQRSIVPSRLFSSSIVHSYAYNQAAEQRSRRDDIAPAAAVVEGLGEDGQLITKFQDLADRGLVDSNIIQNIVNGMGHLNMTAVQTMTINETLKGTDV